MSGPLARDVIAGVSLHAPRTTYVLDDLHFGSAVLERPSRSDRLTLATVTVRAPGVEASEVRFTLDHAGARYYDREAIDVAPLRALIVEHGLYSRPELITGDAQLSGAPAEAASLRAFRVRLAAALRNARPHGDVDVCDVCERLRRVEREELIARKMVEGEAELARTRGHARTMLEYRLHALRALGAGATGAAVDDDKDCVHARYLHAALRAAVVAWPELAFEMAGLLVPARALRPARFVLPAALLQGALTAWLVGERSRRDDRLDDLLGSWRRGRKTRMPSKARRTTHLGDEVPAAMQDVIGWVARAQGSDFERIARTWCAAGTGGATAAATSDVHIASEALLPEGVIAPPPAPTPVPLAPPPPTSVGTTLGKVPQPSPAKKAPPAKSPRTASAKPKAKARPAAPPPPAEELTAGQLRERGHGPKELKRMLRDGELERVSYGWYRLVPK